MVFNSRMNYTELKKLDEDTQKKVKEGSGPVDECLCSLLAPPDEEPKGLRGSIRRAFQSLGGQKKAGSGSARGERGGAGARGGGAVRSTTLPGPAGQNSVEIPLTFSKGGKGIFTTREEVKRDSSCGKCGCDDEKFVLKHSYANIRITTPDVSSICPCPSDCMPDKEKFNSNIKVTVEQVAVLNKGPENSETDLYEEEDRKHINEPEIEKRPISELMENVWKESEWAGDKALEVDPQSTSSKLTNSEIEEKIKEQ